MGVDISLHLEIRRQDKWRLMNVTCPLWVKENHGNKIFDTNVTCPLWVKENHGNKIFDTEVYSCRYYHFRDFLNKAPSHCSDNRDILSEEIRAKLKDDDQTGFGVFMFPDLEKHCDQLEKMLLSSLSHAGIYSIRQQLDRIEQKLDGTSNDAPTEKREEVYEDVYMKTSCMTTDVCFPFVIQSRPSHPLDIPISPVPIFEYFI